MTLLRRLHKWLGLLIGLQVVLWLSSGLTISLLDPAKVSGRYWTQSLPVEPAYLPTGEILEPDELPPDRLRGATGISLTMRHGQMVYRVFGPEGERLLDANNGEILVFDQDHARQTAKQDYLGTGKIVTVQAGKAPDLETRRHAGDYWRVDFSDRVSTSIYISTATGEILERRNTYWRVRDFFWMLHTMDYQTRDDFNNSLIIAIILVAMWLGISGVILLFGSFTRQQFAFLNPFSGKKMVEITLLDPDGGPSRKVSLTAGSNLFLALAGQGIDLPSVCGGGGECGKCRVKIDAAELREPNRVEQGLVPSPLRKKGYRLACQMQAEQGFKLTMPRSQ